MGNPENIPYFVNEFPSDMGIEGGETRKLRDALNDLVPAILALFNATGDEEVERLAITASRGGENNDTVYIEIRVPERFSVR